MPKKAPARKVPRVSTTGHVTPDGSEAAINICFGGIHTLEIDGLSRADLREIASVARALQIVMSAKTTR